MAVDAVGQVRSFQRLVTRRIGVLQEEYLARGRPLGASRLLWEVGSDGADVRSLRTRLGLDSGYLSRLLRRLESEGLVVVEAGPGDHRVRAVRLTAAGLAERAELDRLSDELAGSLLASLDQGERARLVAAMSTVERLLTVGMVEIAVVDPAGQDARSCLEAYARELDGRFDGGFDLGTGVPATDADLTLPAGLLLLARLAGEPVGCAALKFDGTGPAQVKRMWVAPPARGLGVGRRLLHELERQARQRGVRVLRLETNRALTEAIGLYRRNGFEEVPPYNDEPYAHYWFAKRLDDDA